MAFPASLCSVFSGFVFFLSLACIRAKSLQSCPTLCDPMDCSLPGSSLHGILQARILSGLPCPPPGILPTQESNPYLLSLLQCQANSLPVVLPGKLFHSITLYFMSFYIFKCFLIFSPKICVFYWPLRPCTFGVSINMFRFITMLQL